MNCPDIGGECVVPEVDRLTKENAELKAEALSWRETSNITVALLKRMLDDDVFPEGGQGFANLLLKLRDTEAERDEYQVAYSVMVIEHKVWEKHSLCEIVKRAERAEKKVERLSAIETKARALIEGRQDNQGKCGKEEFWALAAIVNPSNIQEVSQKELASQYMQQPIGQHDKYLNDLAKEYHDRTEAYDKLVCTGGIGPGGSIMPADHHESTDINRHALRVLAELQAKACREQSIKGDKVTQAIQQRRN